MTEIFKAEQWNSILLKNKSGCHPTICKLFWSQKSE